jgi:hypothetical protein
MDVYLNLVPIETLPQQLLVYSVYETEPETQTRSIKFKLAADIAKKISQKGSPTFSVGDQIYTTSPISSDYEQTLEIVAGTSVNFKIKLRESEKVNLKEISQGPERLANRIVDWYYRENVPNSFHMENVNYVGQNLFARLEAKYYNRYKINVNEGMLRATRVFSGKPYLILDPDYRVTWEETLWDNVRTFVQNVLNKNVYLPDANTIKAINDEFGRVGKKQGKHVQGKNNLGEYEVLEFDYTKNPETPGTAGTASQVEFFERIHGMKISDRKQPLVRVRVARGIHYGKKNYHVPELLVFDRMPQHIRSNAKLMSALSNITKPEPRGRFGLLLSLIQGDPFGKTKGFADDQFVQRFVRMTNTPLVAKAEVTGPIKVKMGYDDFAIVSHQDFLGKILKKKFHRIPEVKRVSLLFLKEKESQVLNFYTMLRQECAEHGLLLPEAKLIPVEKDNEESYRKAIAEAKGSDLVISFTAYMENLVYDAIKQELLLKFGVLSQNVSYENTLDKLDELSNQRKEHDVKTILTMIGMQLCAKLGGSPWAFSEPIYKENCPILGLDIYHGMEGETQIVGACAAFDPYGEYLFSNVTDPQAPEEKVTTLRNLLIGVLEKYTQAYGKPDKIFIVRDGLNFTQEQAFLYHPTQGEVGVIEGILNDFGVEDYVLVMEKKNTFLRMYKKITQVRVENPDPGTVVIGAPFSRNEMLMVSQETYRGTVEPTLYKVIKPSEPEMNGIATAVHKLCRHHWNTPASIRIPAPAFHADKIEYLVRRVLRRSPTNPLILDRPFYL